VPQPDAAAVIGAVAASRGDLGVFRLDQGASAGAWWHALSAPDSPKVIARLPFIERPDHPAGTPVFVVSKPLTDAAVRDVVLYAAQFERWREAAGRALNGLGGEVIASAGDAHGLSVLLATPGSLAPDTLRQALAGAGASMRGLVEVGSHAERFRVSGAMPA
jgi:hypothetical protein